MSSNFSASHRSPRGEGHLLRERILDATVELMGAVEDANDASVRAVAEKVGKTVPALYQHFESKGALLVAASLHALDHMGATVDAEVNDVIDLDARLRRRARAYVDFARDHPAPYRLLFMAPPNAPNRPATLDMLMNTAGFAGMRRDVAQAQAEGLMISTDIDTIVLVLFSAVHGVASLVVAHPGIDWPDSLLDDVLDSHAFGLVPR